MAAVLEGREPLWTCPPGTEHPGGFGAEGGCPMPIPSTRGAHPAVARLAVSLD